MTPTAARRRSLRLPGALALVFALVLAVSSQHPAVGQGTSGHTASAAAHGASADPITVIVQRLAGTGAAAERAVEAVGGVVGRPLDIIGGFVATVPPAVLPALEAAPGVGAVTEDAEITVQSEDWDASTDTGSMPTTAEIVQAGYMWENGYTGAGVGVALIDTGVVPVQGLDTGVVHGPDLSFEGGDPGLRYLDTHGHGTHMAGIISGRDADWAPGTTTSFGGIAPDATLVSVKVAVANGATDVSQVIAAIDWVVQHRKDHNIRVLNLSFGTDGVQDYRLDPLAFAVENAWHKGIVVVASAGNAGFTGGRLKNPAYDPWVIAVGADDPLGTKPTHDDLVPDWSNRGDGTRNPDLVAPGKSIVSLHNPGSYTDVTYTPTVLGGRFVRGSGTSQAAAVVSGAAALLIQQRPELTPDQVKALLTSTAVPLPEADPQAQGSGLLNIREAARASTPVTAQTHERAAGLGLLHDARGSLRIEIDDELLIGELDAGLNAWTPLLWTYETANDLTWSGGVWEGGKWSGGEWSGGKWSSEDGWSGGKWSGGKWSGVWEGGKWSGGKWSGGKWSGDAWSSLPPER